MSDYLLMYDMRQIICLGLMYTGCTEVSMRDMFIVVVQV
jgi:hypothetical protein